VTEPRTVGPPVVDTAVLEGLCRDLGGDRELVRTVIGAYLEQLDHRRSALSTAIDAGDADGVHAAAHALASTSLTLGVRAVAEPTRSLELEAQRDDLSSAMRWRSALDRVIPDVRAVLGSW
jgi:HPt (histidine-containing phosphotransfer) domain-containing protein